jgi:hypothetical protein
MSEGNYPALSGVTIDRSLINEIRDDEELTAMARIIEGAQREAWFQGFGSDWDKARFSAYLLRRGGFGAVAPATITHEKHEETEGQPCSRLN